MRVGSIWFATWITRAGRLKVLDAIASLIVYQGTIRVTNEGEVRPANFRSDQAGLSQSYGSRDDRRRLRAEAESGLVTPQQGLIQIKFVSGGRRAVKHRYRSAIAYTRIAWPWRIIQLGRGRRPRQDCQRSDRDEGNAAFELLRPLCYQPQSPIRASRPSTMRSLLFAFSLLLLPVPASALCRCTCVRGVMRPVCQQTDIMVPICQGLCETEIRPERVVTPLAGGRTAFDPVQPFDPAPRALANPGENTETNANGLQLGTPNQLSGSVGSSLDAGGSSLSAGAGGSGR